MWLVFPDMFIVPLYPIRYQPDPLIQCALRDFADGGDAVFLPGYYMSQILGEETVTAFYLVENRTSNVLA